MGYTESMVRTMLAQTVGDVDFLEQSVEVQRRFDLSNEETSEFVGRLLAGEVRALLFLASELDELKAAASGG